MTLRLAEEIGTFINQAKVLLLFDYFFIACISLFRLTVMFRSQIGH